MLIHTNDSNRIESQEIGTPYLIQVPFYLGIFPIGSPEIVFPIPGLVHSATPNAEVILTLAICSYSVGATASGSVRSFYQPPWSNFTPVGFSHDIRKYTELTFVGARKFRLACVFLSNAR
ncbi:hypothetical protein [Methylobacterium sp. WL64]|uniref:hypothetical protein n=1 Tax=Methylobacterium sp. WL64 TaxID=2603894 RepID=UPI00164FF95C|nr:hypothetical protein [Methylobacterium sp. WL64]